MLKRQYEENGYLISEYESGARIESIITEPFEEPPQVTIEEQILSENQYQTALLEIQMLGGM